MKDDYDETVKEIKKSLEKILAPGQVTEIRALDVDVDDVDGLVTVNGFFDDYDELAKAAAEITEGAKGVYFIPNPLKPDLLEKSNNQVMIKGKGAGDSDIEKRNWLLIDCDPIRPANTSSSEDEHEQALNMARKIRDELTVDGWSKPIFADSGNGAHLMYKIDLPCDDNGLVKRVLEALAKIYDDDKVKVDKGVFNPARIWKLYGTFARKGERTPERPHRKAKIIWNETPGKLELVPVEKLEELASIVKKEDKSFISTDSFDLEKWIEKHREKLDEYSLSGETEWLNGGKRWKFKICPWNAEHTNGSAFIVQLPSGAIGAGCHHNSCQGKDWHTLQDLIQPGWRENKKKSGKTKIEYLQYEDKLSVKIDNNWIESDLLTLQEQLLNHDEQFQAICPTCKSENGIIEKDIFDKICFRCDDCKKRMREYPIAPGMFSYKAKIYQVEMRNGKFGSMELLKKENFYSGGEYEFVQGVLLTPKNKFLDDNFQIRRLGSANFEKLDYELNFDENALAFKYPALPVEKKDNDFINAWLDEMFGRYSDFIKNWLAMYSYTNYLMLPVIVLSGPRASGKTTFAEVVGEIFPNLLGFWSGVTGNFNEEFKKKLLIVDENKNADKSEQYTAIKEITGKKTQKINEKFTPEYYVPNNINIIITTNDARPVFLKWKEEPETDNTNNFFIYRVPAVSAEKIDNQLQQKIKERLGHYVRSELKIRYEKLASVRRSNCRYTLNAPITNFARELFVSSRTGIEIESEILAEVLVRGIEKYGEIQFSDGSTRRLPEIQWHSTIWKGDKYVMPSQIHELIKKLHLNETRSKKAYINALVEMEVITANNDYHTTHKRYGHKIIRPRSFYPEDGAIGEVDPPF